MDSLENQLRRWTRSWLAWGGGITITLVYAVGIAVTNVTPERVAPPELPPLSLAYARPSADPVDLPLKPRPAAPPDLADAFKFDPTTSNLTPEIPLGSLDISTFGGSLKFFDPTSSAGFTTKGEGAPGWGMLQGLENVFEVRKPEAAGRMTIFERNQVDEIPVWLYGPQPRYPNQFDRDDWNVLVLYNVSERGTTENIFILDSTHPQLVEPVKKAIAEWKFRAARKGGKAVKMWVQQAVNHKEENKSPFTL
jgi:hypothetical protein